MTNKWIKIVGIDGETITKGYKKKTSGILMRLGKYTTTITFDIAPMDTQYYDAVLGMAWLKEQNPIIDWASGTVAVNSSMLKTKIETKDIEKILNLHKESGTSSEKGQADTLRKTRKVTWTQEVEQQENKREIEAQARQIATVRPKPKELYEKELAKVKAKLPEKYYNYIELFVKKEYRLPNHPKEYKVRIPLKPGFKVLSVKQHCKSRDKLEMEDKFIEEFLAAGYIREGRGSASARPLFVLKKDRTKRMVIDYRALNNRTEDDTNKAPHQEQKRDLLQGAKIMTVFDIQWDKSLYEWAVTLMGLKRLPVEFAQFMTYVLIQYLNKFVVVYFNDIIVYSKDPNEHEGHVRQVMTKLMEAGLMLKIKKCEFDTTTVNYLGMIYTPEGLKIQPEKVDAITNWPTPANIKEVQGFLGATGYVRRYIRNYSEHSRPMTELLKKDEEFLKQLVTEAPILALDDPEKRKIIRLDTSGYTLGIALEQVGSDGIVQIVAFYSRQFIAAERNYDVHDRELLVIVEAFKQWRHYLQGVKEETIVKSDHHNLKYFTMTKELTGRQIRWAEYLSRFKFRIEHIKGKENVIPKTNILKEDEDGIRYNVKVILAATIIVNHHDFYNHMIQAIQQDKILTMAITNKEA
ncbi:retrotransposon polyprotein, putative [Talaromyces stipitatus ATCC 10500]|uniref:RNA-directed DNA polymerase n=1 Tax=Talaromyces stipitatus (strain ATCC 10500 / CBS 375.48 / QM 6759 / NRRL 1006) TaxID=441959 RepID=B8MJC4_TALSN|nr:retrotransposon polyprotein, putative [Talaromyces stipitatus ATCC 10500]EED14713.1 retrotransposon polyprotein, putative [Talaromyces stipitatus ATCC 10500]